MDKARFDKAAKKIIGIKRERRQIGVLKEKSVHAVLKNYYEPNEDYHEIPIETYVADIYNRDGEIIEIQTRQFNKLRNKLDCFLKEYNVTVVYPVIRQRNLVWIDSLTGEAGKPRKSPVKGHIYTAFSELYKIKNFLKNEKLHFRFIILDVDDYRLYEGYDERKGRKKKKNAVKEDVFPKELVEEISIDCPQDYIQLIPYELAENFTSAEFAKAAKIHISYAQVTLNIFDYVGIVKRVGKRGNSYLYSVID